MDETNVKMKYKNKWISTFLTDYRRLLENIKGTKSLHKWFAVIRKKKLSWEGFLLLFKWREERKTQYTKLWWLSASRNIWFAQTEMTLIHCNVASNWKDNPIIQDISSKLTQPLIHLLSHVYMRQREQYMTTLQQTRAQDMVVIIQKSTLSLSLSDTQRLQNNPACF